MPQSLVKNYVHIVFSTKHRHDFIKKKYREDLYAYMGEICTSLECYPRAIGGVEDHVHILCLLSQKVALMKLLELMKSNSSRWMKSRGEDLELFYWQNGYGSFSVSPKDVDRVIEYINNQEEIHRNRTFKDEYRLFLKKYEVEYDERYVWD